MTQTSTSDGQTWVVAEVPLSLLDGDNYRSEDLDGVARLAEAIRADGRVHEPIRVRVLPTGRYKVIGGHHRAAAVAIIGWDTIPAWVESGHDDSVRDLLDAVADNATHTAAKSWDEGAALAALVADGVTIEEIMAKCAKPRSWVQNRLDLMGVAARVRPMMASRGFRWCRPLYGLPEFVQVHLVSNLGTSNLPIEEWSAACQAAKADLVEDNNIFSGEAFSLNSEEWDSRAAEYVTAAMAATVDAVSTGCAGLIDIADIALMAGVKPETVRQFNLRGLLPDPVHVFGQTPVWERSVIAEWVANRPGRGRPRSLKRNGTLG